MTQFEFISVFVSILVAIAVTEILMGWGKLLRHRGEARVYWVHIVWTLLFLLLMVWDWYTLLHFRPVVAWTYPRFLLVLARPTVAVLAAVVIAPPAEVAGGEANDLKEFYYKQAPAFFSLGVLYYVAAFSTFLLLKGLDLTNVLVQGLAGAVVGTLAVARRERTHVILTCVVTVLFLEVVVLRHP